MLLVHVHGRDSSDLSLHEHLQTASQRKTLCLVSLTEVNPFLELRVKNLTSLNSLVNIPFLTVIRQISNEFRQWIENSNEIRSPLTKLQ